MGNNGGHDKQYLYNTQSSQSTSKGAPATLVALNSGGGLGGEHSPRSIKMSTHWKICDFMFINLNEW